MELINNNRLFVLFPAVDLISYSDGTDIIFVVQYFIQQVIQFLLRDLLSPESDILLRFLLMNLFSFYQRAATK